MLLEYSAEELNERVLRFANDLALLQFLSVQGQRLKARFDAAKKKKVAKPFLSTLANKIFFIRFSVWDPDRAFEKMARPLWWIWARPAHYIACALILAATFVFLRNYDQVGAALGNLFSFQTVLLMWGRH